jgi:hypothetical protein
MATITLTAKTGYTLKGVAADFFTVDGAEAANVAGSVVITAVFPATLAPHPSEPTPDPTTWTAVATSSFTSSDIINAIAYGNNKFVAVGDGGKMAYSN